MKNNSLIAAAFVAVGLAIAGWFIGHGFVRSRTVDRFVTVKGISERDVQANIALWPIRFVSTADELGTAQVDIERSKKTILQFLEKQGLNSEDVELQRLEVTDVLANPYRSGPMNSRFIINQTIMVRTEEPELIQAASQNVSELVSAGVVLSTEGGYGQGPTFLFKELSPLKPEMIAEATANARRAAEQFALDSGSRLGGIRNANQGVFVILPRDGAQGISETDQIQKTVRVVSTIEYYLED